MRKALMTALFFSLLANPAYAQSPELPGWKLVWSDEFNYSGHPDPAKWGYEEGYVSQTRLYPYRVPEHFAVVDHAPELGVKDGFVPIPARPGLGAELVEEKMRPHLWTTIKL